MPAPDFLAQREQLNDDITSFIQQQTPGCNQGFTEAKPQKFNMSITSEIITIKPDDARRYLSNMVHNRPLSQANVKTYAADIESGKWCLNGQGIIFDGKGRLLDGQHRMHAIIRANRPVQTLVIHGVSPETFSRMDIGNKRTVADVIDVKHRNTVAGACKYLFREMSGSDWWNTNCRPRPMDGVNIIKAHPGIVDSVSSTICLKGAAKMIVGSALGYCHYRVGKEDAELRDTFFTSLNSGADLGVRSPILALRNALTPVAGMRATDAHQIALFICAWNMFSAGLQCKFIRLPKDMPKWSTSL
jgi:hypothetical protein